MKKYLVVCLLVVSLIVQCAEKRNSGKRDFLSKSDLGESTKKQDEHQLSRSAPMLIPQKKQCKEPSPSSFTDLIHIGSPNLLTFTKATEVFIRKKNPLEENIDENIPK